MVTQTNNYLNDILHLYFQHEFNFMLEYLQKHFYKWILLKI